MKQLKRERVIYSFSQEHEPILTVKSGETVEIETYDCFENQVHSENMKVDAIDWTKINPATGPIYIEEAKPGDILKVEINKIELDSSGFLATGTDLGVLGHRLEQITFKQVMIDGDFAVFNENIRFPLTPMIGVIGVAPSGEAVPCGTPGAHGGNLDTTLMKEGATLYLPVFAEGALFALGDFHAAMGDGEVGASGVEIAGKATVTLEVIKGDSVIQEPVIESEQFITFVATDETIDAAIKRATETAIDFLQPLTDLSLDQFTMLMSAVGQAQISQIVNPLKTARFSVPKSILKQYEIKLFN